jgi:chemotaxis protein CheZ
MQDEILSRMSEKISADVTRTVQQTLERVVEQQVAKALHKALVDSEFYRGVNVDVQSGLNKIYLELLQLKRETGSLRLPEHHQAEELFGQATHKLDGIIRITESATIEIMDIIEHQMVMAEKFSESIRKGSSNDQELTREALGFVETLNTDFLRLMTALSFQDITGQHIRKIIDFIKRIEDMISQLYVSHDLMLKDKERNPEKDAKDIREDVERRISQGDIDALLANYGV